MELNAWAVDEPSLLDRSMFDMFCAEVRARKKATNVFQTFPLYLRTRLSELDSSLTRLDGAWIDHMYLATSLAACNDDQLLLWFQDWQVRWRKLQATWHALISSDSSYNTSSCTIMQVPINRNGFVDLESPKDAMPDNNRSSICARQALKTYVIRVVVCIVVLALYIAVRLHL